MFSNIFLNPAAVNKTLASDLTWEDAAKIIYPDLVALVAATGGGASTFSALTDAYNIAATAGQVPMTNSAGTALIPINILGDGVIEVDAATTAALAGSPVYDNGASGVGATLTKGSNGAFPSQDGVVSTVGHRYLVKNQASSIQNGVYELTTLGTGGTPWVLTRTTDSDTSAELDPQVVIPSLGTTNKRKVYSQTTQSPVLGTNNIVYLTTAVATGMQKAIYDPANLNSQLLGIPISKTVLEMQALIGSFIPGQLYKITGIAVAQNVVLDATFIAISASAISTTGWSDNFKSIATLTEVEVRIDYILSTDEITLIYCPSSRNLITANAADTAGLYGVPLDSATIFDNEFHSISSAVIDPESQITRSTFSAGSVIEFASGTSFSGFTEPGASITMAGTSSFNGTLEAGSILSMIGTQTLTNCRVGNGKTLDMTTWPSGYSATGKIYIDGLSTFVCDAVIDLNGLATLPINNWSDGGNYSACGIFTGIGNTGTSSIDEIATYLTDHDITIMKLNGNSISYIVGNRIVTNGGFPVITDTPGDTIKLIPNPIIGADCFMAIPILIQTPVGVTGDFDAADIAAAQAHFTEGKFTGVS